MVNLIRSVDEVFELKFVKFEGEMLPCANFLKEYFELYSRNIANRILKKKETIYFEDDYYNSMEAISILRQNGIYFDLVQIKKSPWESYSDEEVEKLLFFGEWINLSLELKLKWLDSIRVMNCMYTYKGNRISSYRLVDSIVTYELDGRKIVDYPSFFIALGEAINGFGGYFGGCLHGLADCLCGGWGTPKSFIIKWNYSEESRKNSGALWEIGDFIKI